MRLIQLTKGKTAKVDDVDFDQVNQFKWKVRREKHGTRGYYAVRLECKSGKTREISMARFIMQPPVGMIVDHSNGDTLDNRRENLRLATNAENQHNQRVLRKDNTSGYKGVTWSVVAGMWNAQIYVNKKRIHLGYFMLPENAALAYDEAARKYFGEFAATNSQMR